jgi:branched-chain amino acid transport system substrate-binding protein
MRHRPFRLIGPGLLSVALVTSACGTRVSRDTVARAERGGLPLPAASVGGQASGLPESAQTTASAEPSAIGRPGVPLAADPTQRAGAPAGSGNAPAEPSVAGPRGKTGAVSPAAAPRQSAVQSTPSRGQQSASLAAPPGQPVSATPRAGKASLAVGTVATLSGPVGAFVKDSTFAISVWAKWINGKGGVSGHPVRHIVVDDGGDPARYNASVRQLAEEQGVVAFLFNTIGLAGGDLSYVSQKRIPIIGHEAGTEDAYTNSMVFTPYPSGLSYAYALIAGFAQAVVPEGKKKLATIACADVKLCDLFDRTWNGPAARELGFENVYRARASLTQPDYTAECLSARQAGAQVILGAIDNNSYLRLGHACARQNYKPIIGIADQLALPSVAADPVMDGDVVITKVAPWPDTSIPGTAQLHQTFAQIAPGTEVNGAHAGGWVTAKTFEAAARNLPERPAPADVLNGLWALNGDALDGMTFPLAFPREQPSPRRSCWGLTLIQGGKFIPMPNGKLKCKA